MSSDLMVPTTSSPLNERRGPCVDQVQARDPNFPLNHSFGESSGVLINWPNNNASGPMIGDQQDQHLTLAALTVPSVRFEWT